MTHTPCAPSAPAENYDTLDQTLRNARSLLVILGSRTDSIIAEMVRQLDHHIAEQAASSPDDASELAKAVEEIARLKGENQVQRILLNNPELVGRRVVSEITALRAQIAALKAANEEMRAALKGYERWEGKLLLDYNAWRGSLPTISQECFDELVVLQAQRNAALASSSADGGGK